MCTVLLKVYRSLFLAVVRLTDRWSNFFETRINRLMGRHLLSSAISKKKEKYVKYSVEVHSGKYSTWYM